MAGNILPIDRNNLLPPVERTILLPPSDRARLFPTAEAPRAELPGDPPPGTDGAEFRQSLAEQERTRREEDRENREARLRDDARLARIASERAGEVQARAAPESEPRIDVPATRTREEVIRDLAARSFGLGTLFDGRV